MTDLETRVREGLARAAQDAPGDPDRVRRALQDRLPGTAERRPRHGRARVLLPAAAAVAVLAATAGVGALLPDHDRSTPRTPATQVSDRPVERPVSDTWACPVRRTVDLTRTQVGNTDPGLYEVSPGRAPAEAWTFGVPRFDYSLSGGAGTLAYGDAGGRRTAVTTLVRDDAGDWRMTERTLCTGTGGDPSATTPDAGVLDPARRAPLRTPTTVPARDPSPNHERPADPARLVQVDNRTTYDQVGRQEPASTFAYFDGRRMFLLTTWGDTAKWGESGSMRLDRPLLEGLLPSAATQEPFVRLDFDEAQRGTAVPVLAQGDDLSAMELRVDGKVVRAREFGTPSWGRTRLFAAIAPPGYRGDRLRELTVVLTDRAGHRTTHHLR